MVCYVAVIAVLGLDDTVTRSLTSIAPRVGSISGGTRVVIKGTGFSATQALGGSNVVMIGDVECKALEGWYYSNFNQIVCDTSPHPHSSWLDVKVTVRDVEMDGADKLVFSYEIPLNKNCKFQYF